jgi:hypothetical protein
MVGIHVSEENDRLKRLQTTEIGEVQGATRTQHASHLGQAVVEVLQGREVMQRHGTDHRIETVIGEAVQAGDVALAEIHVAQGQLLHMALRVGEHCRREVEAGEGDFGIELRDLGKLCRRTAAEVEDSLAPLDDLADTRRMEQVRRGHDAVDATGFRVGGNLLRVVHDQVWLGLAWQAAADQQFAQEGRDQGGVRHRPFIYEKAPLAKQAGLPNRGGYSPPAKPD